MTASKPIINLGTRYKERNESLLAISGLVILGYPNMDSVAARNKGPKNG